jgi:hypothetical protein
MWPTSTLGTICYGVTKRYVVILACDERQKPEATRPLDRQRPIYFADFASFMAQ